MNSALYSSYRPVEDSLLAYVGKIVPQRRFDHAGGVWREVPRKPLRLRRLAYLLATASIGYWAWGHHALPVTVTLSPAVSKNVPVYLEANALVQASQTVTVHPLVDGQLSEIIFKEGQDVKAGDVLAKLDPRTYQMQYDEATVNKAQDEAMLVQGKRELAGIKGAILRKRVDAKELNKMLEEKRAQIQQFESAVQSDQVTIDTLKMELDRSVIVSPIDGRTGIRQVDAGNMVHASDTNGLVVITQVEPVSVVFTLPEKTLRPISDRLSKGEKVAVLAMDADNKNILDQGTIELVDNQVDMAGGGTIHLKASFPNHKRLLWPGASVHVRLLASTLNGAVVVPVAAVHMPPAGAVDAKTESKPWVYVYKAGNNTIEKRTVKITMTEDGDAVIGEGIHAGDKVVTDSLSPVVDGSAVAPKTSLIAAHK